MEQTSAKRKNISYHIRTFLVTAAFAAMVLCFRLGALPAGVFTETMLFPLSDLFIILGAGLCGYRYGLVMFLMIFLTETAVSGGNIIQLFPLFLYLVIALLSGKFSQNRWYSSVRKTLMAFVILEAALSGIFYLIFAFILTGGEIGIVSAFIGTLPEAAIAVLLLWLYFRFVPDRIKRAFGVGNRYTKDYNAHDENYGNGRYAALKRRITIISILEGILFAVLSNAQFSAVLETFEPFFRAVGEENPNEAFVAPAINDLTINLSVLLLSLTLSISVAVIANEAILNMVLQVTGEQQKLETELKVAKAKSDAKSSFLSSMSHEIRTPINAVLGMNEMVLRECEDENILTYSESIRTAGNTLLGLVNDILDFSKIEAGKMDIIPVDYDIASTLNDLVNMVQTRAEEKGLVLKLDIDGNIPKLLHGDDVRIKQVITNILTNAVKYTEKGSVTFSVGFSKIDESSIDLRVSIADTGIGIKNRDIPKLFTEFDRIEEERNRSIEGTGLGMSITQKLLALMNSRLEVKSEYGKGSVFAFTLRQTVVKWEPVGNYEEAFRRSLANRKKYRERFTAPDAYILVVDDTPMNLEVIVSLLKKTSIKIDTAESGDECIALAAKHKYDVILLDHMMPVKNGIETLAELKAMPDNPNVGTPAICLTANAVSGAREQYLAAGFDDYLTKPVEPGKLEEMLLAYLPEDKIRNTGETGGEKTTNPAIPSIVSDIKEINISEGIRHCGIGEIYLETLTAFAEAVGEQTDVIEQYWDARDIENLTIKIHAIKSTSRIIGAADIGALAERLEKAGHDNDITALENGMDELLTRCRSLGLQLSPLVKRDDDSALPHISPEELSELYGIIREFYSVADYDSITQMIENIGSYRIPDSEKERCKALREAADAIDYDLIPEILDKE